MYHLRRPESTTDRPLSYCGSEPERIMLGNPDRICEGTHNPTAPRMTEWDWVRAQYERQPLKNVCDICVAVHHAEQRHRDNWKEKTEDASSEEIPF